jgi:hypothetical protein
VKAVYYGTIHGLLVCEIPLIPRNYVNGPASLLKSNDYFLHANIPRIISVPDMQNAARLEAFVA